MKSNRTLLALVLLVVAVAGLWGAWKYFDYLETSNAPAHAITCRELIDNGTGGHTHLVVSDALMVTGGYVYEYTEGSSNWEKVWVPLVPIDSAYAERWFAADEFDEVEPPRSIRVLVRYEDVSSEAELLLRADATSFEVLVVNAISFGEKSTYTEQFREIFPAVEIDQCWVLDPDLGTSGVLAAAWFFGLLAAGGVIAAVVVLVRSPPTRGDDRLHDLGPPASGRPDSGPSEPPQSNRPPPPPPFWVEDER